MIAARPGAKSIEGRRRAIAGLLHAGRRFSRAAAAGALLTGAVIPAVAVQAHPGHDGAMLDAYLRSNEGGVRDPATEFLKEKGDLSSQEAIELADLHLASRLDRVKDKNARELIADQRSSLGAVGKLIETADGPAIFDRKIEMAKQASRIQAQKLGVTLNVSSTSSATLWPSKAVASLLSHHQIKPTNQQERDIKALDRLPAPVRDALAETIYAFRGLEAAAETAGTKALPTDDPEEKNKVETLMKKLGQDRELIDRFDQDSKKFAEELEAETAKKAAGLTPDEEKLLKKLTVQGEKNLGQIGSVLGPLLSARLGLLDASAKLAKAVAAVPQAEINRALSEDNLPPVSAGDASDPKPHSVRATPAPGAGNQSSPANPPPGSGGAPHPTAPAAAGAPVLPAMPVPAPAPSSSYPKGAPNQLRLAQVAGPSCIFPTLDILPVLALELEGVDNDGKPGNGCIYGLDRDGDGVNDKPDQNSDGKVDESETDYRLLVDVGGNDIYRNNAGGSGHLGVPRTAVAGLKGPGVAGALIDLKGSDRYVSGRSDGVNGGAAVGFLNLVASAGFLFDAGPSAEESDHYSAGSRGINGGGYGHFTGPGVGFLLDIAGGDTYSAGEEGTNGGGFIPYQGLHMKSEGLGFLMDAGGKDSYTASHYGVNGGGATFAAGGHGFGMGFLVDSSGDDTYTSGGVGTNGGGYGEGALGAAAGQGFLLDSGGDDTYTSGDAGTNGGGYGLGRAGAGAGQGFLLDSGGDDTYTSGDAGTNGGGYGQGVLGAAAGQGFLLDTSGKDGYTSGDAGTNGGAAGYGMPGTGSAVGYLTDSGGNDGYSAGQTGTNGGTNALDAATGTGIAVAGRLFDGAGSDLYADTNSALCSDPSPAAQDCNGSGPNRTVVPKGRAGAQVDSPIEPVVFISDVSQREADAGSANFEFKVSLDRVPAVEATVDFKTDDGTATVADGDFQFQQGLVRFGPGETMKTISIKVNGDTKGEPDETFEVNLSNPKNVQIGRSTEIAGRRPAGGSAQGDGQGLGTILTDDLPGVSIGDVSVREGDSGTSKAGFTVFLSNPDETSPVTVHVETQSGTATLANNDYSHTGQDLTFSPGQASQTVEVLVNGDIQSEPDEIFLANLTSPSPNAQIGDGQGEGVIKNDDGGFRVEDVTVAEEDQGSTSARFTVSFKRKDAAQAATVDYSTADASASVADEDYQAAGGTMSFLAGETTRTFAVPVNGDTQSEAEETFQVDLKNGSAGILDSVGIGTITNDDGGLSINDVTVAEGHAGSTEAVFTVSLPKPPEKRVTVDYKTSDGASPSSGNATVSDNDYQASEGTVTFDAGETQETISVKVNGDRTGEQTEEYLLNLDNPSGAIIVDPEGKGLITNDDAMLWINDVTVKEPKTGSTQAVFTVSLSPPQAQAVSASFATQDGSATGAEIDYVPTFGTVTFAAGETAKDIAVPVNSDERIEPAEDFYVKLSNPAAPDLVRGRSRGTALITDDNYQYQDGGRGSGGIFVSGHDSEEDAGGVDDGPENIIRRAVAYVTHGKPQPRLLYVTGLGVPYAETHDLGSVGSGGAGASIGAIGAGASAGIGGMQSAGFRDFDIARARSAAEAGGAALGVEEFANKDVATVDFSDYDVVVVACSDGCGLTQDELNALILRSAEIRRYVNGGGGLVAFEESRLVGQFGFLPLRGPATLIQWPGAFRVTNFGSEIGITDGDVNQGISHNVFPDASGFGVVEVDVASRFVTLATRKLIGPLGVIDDPGDGHPRVGDDLPPGNHDDPARDVAAAVRVGTAPPQPPPTQFSKPAAHPSLPRGDVTPAEPPAAALKNPGQGAQNTATAASAHAQMQAQMQAQAQSQTAVQVQAVAVPMVEAAPGLQVKTEQVREPDRKTSSGPPRKDSGHLASALSHSAASGALSLAGLAALMTFALSLIKPKNPRTPQLQLAPARSRCNARPSQTRPKHRRR